MLKKLLIANRGKEATRFTVYRTLEETVAC